MISVKTLKDVRQINRNKILQQVYFHGPLSRLEICHKTGLSPATVGNLMIPLMDEGIVKETGFEDSSGGRRRVILETNPDLGFFVGIDLGRTYIQIELYNFHMELKGGRKYLLYEKDFNVDSISDIIKKETKTLLYNNSVEMNSILGVGLALPGLVDSSMESVVWAPEDQWVGVYLKPELENYFPTSVIVDNGAKAMALAEYWYGAGRGCDNIVSSILGRGVGSGLIIDGKLLRGASNFTGEWGHTAIYSADPDGENPEVKTMESMINDSLNRFWERKGRVDDITKMDPKTEVNTIKILAEEGDESAEKVISELTGIMGLGISNIINLFNPELVIMGGWMGIALFDLMLPGISNRVRKLSLPPAGENVRIVASHFGEGGSCIGAASLVINQYLGFEI